MRNYITFAGRDLRDFGVYISGSGIYNAPIRAYEEVEIPGRDGLLLGHEKRLGNVEITYPAFIYADFKENIGRLKTFLLSNIGYQRMEDTYYPEYFRIGAYYGGLEVEPTSKNDAGSFEITFQCKPQRFLKSGQTAIIIDADDVLTNPTEMSSRPLVRCYGTGSVAINGTQITVLAAREYTDIDCEMYDAFYGPESRNAYITFDSADMHFPELSPGDNSVSYTGFTKVEITPRWYRL
jgi:phage-related protein